MNSPESPKIGPYRFTQAIPLDEARPPAQPGVYLLKVDNAVKYIGAANNLQKRVNYGHPKAKELLGMAGKKLERLQASWHVSQTREAAEQFESFMIARFKGRTLNQQKTTEHWKTYDKD